jgi:hypothetical protein
MKLHLTLSLLFLLPTVPASAAELWRFETDEGVVSFVDDAKKIPEKYRARAVKQEAKGLDTYARASVSGASVRTAPAYSAPSVVMSVPDDGGSAPRDYIRTKEYNWVDGAFGAPGEVYTLTEVVRDVDGEIVSVELHDPDTVHVVSGR